MAIKLSDSIDNLPKVGTVTERYFNNLGIYTVADLLWHLPSGYQDLSKISRLNQLQPNSLVTVRAILQTIANKPAHRRRLTVTEGLISDREQSLPVIWFNQPYLMKSLEPGREYFFNGKIQLGQRGLQLLSPEVEPVKTETIHTARIIPSYHLSGRLTSKLLRYLIKQILPRAAEIADWLPPDIQRRQKLLPLPEALRQIHFPDSMTRQAAAQKRLAFDELFLLQILVQKRKRDLQQFRAPAIPFEKTAIRNFVATLPFELTKAQRRAAWEILQDLEKTAPMNRLLEGDVGSGKTVVAALALLEVARAKKQGVLMAPTEVLAQQHFQKLAQLFDKYDLTLALLTNTYQKIVRRGQITAAPRLRASISRGTVDIIIGTHALIQDQVKYKDLALVIVDEQHRFGVKQRQALHDKTPDQIPHFLSMTATPIPRTLSLTLYGDLDISLLDEMPKNRRPVKTFYIPPDKRSGAYEFIRREVANGRQVFVICPLIEESDRLGVRAVTREQEKLSRQIFPALRVGLLHGQLKPEVKERAMKNFTAGKTQILVSTAVVEVGVDVPNATVMLIEGADRFGLAQLHQFRGRVGRGAHQSYCFLFTDAPTDNTKKRLSALVKSRDGFVLAEQDLRQRGPGDFFGTRQSGLPGLKVASLTDLALIKTARTEASHLLKSSLNKYPKIKEKISQWEKKIHWE